MPLAMKKCPACNAAFSADESFCSNDGAKLIESMDNPPTEFRFACLDGMEGEFPSPRWRPITFAAVWTVGIISFLLIGVTSIGFRTPRRNDLSALQTVHVIQMAQLQYADTYSSTGFACSLMALGGNPESGPPIPTAAQILRDDFSNGVRNGYFFEIRNCVRKKVNGTDQVTGYTILAVPQTVGKTGDRGFCSDQSGTIRFDPAGGDNCTLKLGE
jgi:type IV pilus assembly protein PilA